METITFESLVKQIAEQLSNAQSLEIENGYYYVYYLHIDEDGNIKDYRKGLNPNDDMLTCCAGSFEEYADVEELYEKEDLDDEDFRSICENLAEQYMKEYFEEA